MSNFKNILHSPRFKRFFPFLILTPFVLIGAFLFVNAAIRISKIKPSVETVFPKGARFVPDQIIVMFKNGKSPGDLSVKKKLTDVGVVSVSKLFGGTDPLLRNYYILNLKKGASIKQTYTLLSQIPEIGSVTPDYILTIQETPNDPQFPYMWDLQQINISQAWDLQHGKDSISVAVIDTGVDYNHEDLASKIILGRNFINNTDDPMDDQGHGTHVAGTIAAVTNNGLGISSVSWGATVLAIKACDENGDCDTSNVVKGIRYAVDRGAKIINISISGEGSCNGTYNDIVSYAKQKGVFVISAAGNHNMDALREIPGACDSVFSVGSVTVDKARAPSSNFGAKVELSAPGGSSPCSLETCILSTGLNNGYTLRTGTSMSAPHVSGVAALLLSQNRNYTPDHLRTCLIKGADQIVTDKPIGGLLNAEKTLFSCPTNPESTSPISGSDLRTGNSSGTGYIVSTDPNSLFRFIVNSMVILAIVLSLMSLLYSGLTWITSAGDLNKIASSKKRVTASVAGLVIVLFSWFLVSLVLKTLTGSGLGTFRLGSVSKPTKNEEKIIVNPDITPRSNTRVQNFIISGNVWTKDAKPIQGAEVILSGDLNLSVLTNSAGEYEFSGLTKGTYTVTLSVNGAIVGEPEDIVLTEQKHSANADFFAP